MSRSKFGYWTDDNHFVRLTGDFNGEEGLTLEGLEELHRLADKGIVNIPNDGFIPRASEEEIDGLIDLLRQQIFKGRETDHSQP